MPDVVDLDAAREEHLAQVDGQLKLLRGLLGQALKDGDARAQERVTAEMTKLLDQRGKLMPRRAGRRHADDQVAMIRMDIAQWLGTGLQQPAVVALAREKWSLGKDHAAEEVRNTRRLIRDSLGTAAVGAQVALAFQVSLGGLVELARDTTLEPSLRVQALRSLAMVGQMIARSAGGLPALRVEGGEERPLRDTSTAEILARLQELRGTG